jgi:glycosyltransferase involved in cell wall biosynthesis
LKVLLSSYQCLPNQGSELGNGWHWARALTDAGHHVTVLTQESHIIRAAAPPDIEFMHVPTTGESRVQKAVAPLGGLGKRVYWLDHYLHWQDAALEHMQAQPRARFDVVHHASWGSLRLGSKLWRLDAPLVYGPIGGGQVAPGNYWRTFGHEWPFEMMRTAASTRWLLQANPRCRETIRNAAVTLVTNSATGAACRELGARDVRYMLADGLPTEWLAGSRTRPTGTPIVLWVGRFEAHKAPGLALAAFAELRRATPARLVMAGDGPLFDETRELVHRLGLDADVDLLGRVPWTEMIGLYDSATAFLFTSLRDSSSSQFLEALGRGLPAVVLDHHGIGDAEVGDAAVKVALPHDPRRLPSLLGTALLDVVTGRPWAERSAAGVAWAAQQTWAAKATRATTIYAELRSAAPSSRGSLAAPI